LAEEKITVSGLLPSAMFFPEKSQDIAFVAVVLLSTPTTISDFIFNAEIIGSTVGSFKYPSIMK
jgi:hypothetical protein